MKPKFTLEQVEYICYQIGEWYLQCKDNMVNWEQGTHRLGYEKERLKYMIFGQQGIEFPHLNTELVREDADSLKEKEQLKKYFELKKMIHDLGLNVELTQMKLRDLITFLNIRG